MLAIHFLLLEARKLVEDTFPDYVDAADEEQAIQITHANNALEDHHARHVSFVQQRESVTRSVRRRESWWKRMMSPSGLNGVSTSSAAAIDQTTHHHSHVLRQTSRKTYKHLVPERGWQGAPSSQGSSHTHHSSERTFASLRREHAPHIASWATRSKKVHPYPFPTRATTQGVVDDDVDLGGETRSFRDPPATWLRRVSTHMSAGQLGGFSEPCLAVPRASARDREASSQEEPAPPAWLPQRQSGLGQAKAASDRARTYTCVRRALRAIDIDLDYFRSGWNWLALSCFSSVLATCTCYIQVWQTCHALISDCSLPRPSGGGNLTVRLIEPWPSECQDQVRTRRCSLPRDFRSDLVVAGAHWCIPTHLHVLTHVTLMRKYTRASMALEPVC